MTKKKSHESFVEEVNNKFGQGVYTVLEEYQGCKKPVLIRHNICNYSWSVTKGNLFNGQSKCPKCSNKIRRNTNTFKERVFELLGDEYTVEGKYVNNYTLIQIRHNLCGYLWTTYPYGFTNIGYRCPNCSGRVPCTTEVVKERLMELFNNEYTLVNKSKNNRSKIKLKHKTCKKIFNTTPSDFFNLEQRCPVCFPVNSKGEIKIQEYLMKNKYKYIAEYSFSDCKNINKLPFDFAIFSENKELKLLIEFDGGQHYEPVEWFGGVTTFEKIKINDEIKNEYCRNNDIKLLRIPYWDYEFIDEVLNNYFNMLNKH